MPLGIPPIGSLLGGQVGKKFKKDVQDITQAQFNQDKGGPANLPQGFSPDFTSKSFLPPALDIQSLQKDYSKLPPGFNPRTASGSFVELATNSLVLKNAPSKFNDATINAMIVNPRTPIWDILKQNDPALYQKLMPFKGNNVANWFNRIFLDVTDPRNFGSFVGSAVDLGIGFAGFLNNLGRLGSAIVMPESQQASLLEFEAKANGFTNVRAMLDDEVERMSSLPGIGKDVAKLLTSYDDKLRITGKGKGDGPRTPLGTIGEGGKLLVGIPISVLGGLTRAVIHPVQTIKYDIPGTVLNITLAKGGASFVTKGMGKLFGKTGFVRELFTLDSPEVLHPNPAYSEVVAPGRVTGLDPETGNIKSAVQKLPKFWSDAINNVGKLGPVAREMLGRVEEPATSVILTEGSKVNVAKPDLVGPETLVVPEVKVSTVGPVVFDKASTTVPGDSAVARQPNGVKVVVSKKPVDTPSDSFPAPDPALNEYPEAVAFNYHTQSSTALFENLATEVPKEVLSTIDLVGAKESTTGAPGNLDLTPEQLTDSSLVPKLPKPVTAKKLGIMRMNIESVMPWASKFFKLLERYDIYKSPDLFNYHDLQRPRVTTGLLGSLRVQFAKLESTGLPEIMALTGSASKRFTTSVRGFLDTEVYGDLGLFTNEPKTPEAANVSFFFRSSVKDIIEHNRFLREQTLQSGIPLTEKQLSQLPVEAKVRIAAEYKRTSIENYYKDNGIDVQDPVADLTTRLSKRAYVMDSLHQVLAETGGADGLSYEQFVPDYVTRAVSNGFDFTFDEAKVNPAVAGPRSWFFDMSRKKNLSLNELKKIHRDPFRMDLFYVNSIAHKLFDSRAEAMGMALVRQFTEGVTADRAFIQDATKGKIRKQGFHTGLTEGVQISFEPQPTIVAESTPGTPSLSSASDVAGMSKAGNAVSSLLSQEGNSTAPGALFMIEKISDESITLSPVKKPARTGEIKADAEAVQKLVTQDAVDNFVPDPTKPEGSLGVPIPKVKTGGPVTIEFETPEVRTNILQQFRVKPTVQVAQAVRNLVEYNLTRSNQPIRFFARSIKKVGEQFGVQMSDELATRISSLHMSALFAKFLGLPAISPVVKNLLQAPTLGSTATPLKWQQRGLEYFKTPEGKALARDLGLSTAKPLEPVTLDSTEFAGVSNSGLTKVEHIVNSFLTAFGLADRINRIKVGLGKYLQVMEEGKNYVPNSSHAGFNDHVADMVAKGDIESAAMLDAIGSNITTNWQYSRFNRPDLMKQSDFVNMFTTWGANYTDLFIGGTKRQLSKPLQNIPKTPFKANVSRYVVGSVLSVVAAKTLLGADISNYFFFGPVITSAFGPSAGTDVVGGAVAATKIAGNALTSGQVSQYDVNKVSKAWDAAVMLMTPVPGFNGAVNLEVARELAAQGYSQKAIGAILAGKTSVLPKNRAQRSSRVTGGSGGLGSLGSLK